MEKTAQTTPPLGAPCGPNESAEKENHEQPDLPYLPGGIAGSATTRPRTETGPGCLSKIRKGPNGTRPARKRRRRRQKESQAAKTTNAREERPDEKKRSKKTSRKRSKRQGAQTDTIHQRKTNRKNRDKATEKTNKKNPGATYGCTAHSQRYECEDPS